MEYVHYHPASVMVFKDASWTDTGNREQGAVGRGDPAGSGHVFYLGISGSGLLSEGGVALAFGDGTDPVGIFSDVYLDAVP